MDDGADDLIEPRRSPKGMIVPSGFARASCSGERGIVPPRPDQIHANIINSPFQGRGFHQTKLPGFRSGIGRLPGGSLMGGIGPHNDD